MISTQITGGHWCQQTSEQQDAISNFQAFFLPQLIWRTEQFLITNHFLQENHEFVLGKTTKPCSPAHRYPGTHLSILYSSINNWRTGSEWDLLTGAGAMDRRSCSLVHLSSDRWGQWDITCFSGNVLNLLSSFIWSQAARLIWTKQLAECPDVQGKTVNVSVIREAYTEKLVPWIRTWRKRGTGKGREGTETHLWRNNEHESFWLLPLLTVESFVPLFLNCHSIAYP